MRFSRSANTRAKFSGTCWITKIGTGKDVGRQLMRLATATGPPLKTPIATSLTYLLESVQQNVSTFFAAKFCMASLVVHAENKVS